MLNFTYQNPVKIVFGKGTIAQLKDLVPAGVRLLMTYGGGSIKANGVYDQVKNALVGREILEFGGIEPNPRYETCMKAVEIVKAKGVGFLLAVGGGSVVDGTKFVALASCYKGADPWELLAKRQPGEAAIPLGVVLTLPATGSEMNAIFVLSRESTRQKLGDVSPHVMPQFSILDPETTFSLPPRQVSNGIIDAFVHVMEQYLTYDVNAPLQARQAEAVLLTLIEEGPKTLANPTDYGARANLMWCATHGLNGIMGCGVPGDWSTHMIGHELTAEYGMDHARSLAAVLPGVMQYQRKQKRERLLQYGRRVWGLTAGGEETQIDQAIARTEEFFRSVGVPTRLSDSGIPADAPHTVARRLDSRGVRLGEHRDISGWQAQEILALRV
jgi:NADP-dependent alcohol dehydrogenase